MAETPGKELEALNGGEPSPRDEPDEMMTGSSSESEGDDGEDVQAEVLEKSLAENPYDYDTHVQYIRCLRKLGDFEKLQQARRSMHGIYPLSPNMWQEWAKDESLIGESSEKFSAIVEIYEKGVHEYLSVPLWCDYLNFVQENDPMVRQCTHDGVSKMRGLFEQALTAAGLHLTEGSKIWDSYREFEQAIYLTVNDDSDEEKSKQIQRIRSLFCRQLAIPLAGMESLMDSYMLWEAEQGNAAEKLDDLSSNCASAYQKALEMFNVRVPYEDLLAKVNASDSDKLQSIMNYVKFEESLGDPARVQILYERAVSLFPISYNLWHGYTSYLDKTLKVSNVLKDVYYRATRNCPWIGDLWTRYLLSLERVNASEEELFAVFEKSILCSFSSIDEYQNLFLTRIDGLRRRLSSSSTNGGLEYGLLRETFQRAADYLSPQLTNVEDLLHLHAYWARLEVTLGKDLTSARGIWESLIKKSGSAVEVWQGYIAMEIGMGHISEARSIYRRCYSKRFNGTGSEEICHSWLRFEREFGSLDDLEFAEKKVIPRLSELKLFKNQQESNTAGSLNIRKDFTSGKASQKRKVSGTSDKQPSSAKRPRDADNQSNELSNATAEKDDGAVKLKPPLEITGDAHLASKTSKESATKESSRKIYTDQCTAYVSNLSLEASEDHLREFFNDGGGVTAIRLMRDKFTGKSRGYAYVDFADEEHLAAAISKNKQKLLEKKLSVARSDPKKRQEKSFPKGNVTKPPVGNVEATPETRPQNKAPSNRGRGIAVSHRRGGHVQLVGRNTFAVPRNLARPLGWSDNESRPEGGEQPKSNDEFRKLLLKK